MKWLIICVIYEDENVQSNLQLNYHIFISLLNYNYLDYYEVTITD